MDKIKLCVRTSCYYNDDGSGDDFEPEVDNEEILNLLNSDREYSDVELVVNNDHETMMFMTAFLLKFSKSIKHLKIVKYGGHFNFLNKSMPFDKLESIELFASCSALSTEFMVNCTNLKKVTLDGLPEKSVKKLLQRNWNIEELILYENCSVTYLNLNLSLIFINLKTFGYLDHITSGFALHGEFEAEEWTGSNRKMLMKFLMCQSPTLETLRLDKVYIEDLSTILEFLPHLRNLEINKIIGDVRTLNLPVNTTIEVFMAATIKDFFLLEIMKKIINLNTLFIHNLKTHQFIMLWENAVELKNFAYCWASSSERINGPFVDLEKLSKNISFEAREKFNIIKTTKINFLKNYIK